MLHRPWTDNRPGDAWLAEDPSHGQLSRRTTFCLGSSSVCSGVPPVDPSMMMGQSARTCSTCFRNKEGSVLCRPCSSRT